MCVCVSRLQTHPPPRPECWHDDRAEGRAAAVTLTNDVCEQQGQRQREQRGGQGRALPVAAAVGLVEGKQWSGHAAAREGPRWRGVHRARCEGVTLARPGQQGR